MPSSDDNAIFDRLALPQKYKGPNPFLDEKPGQIPLPQFCHDQRDSVGLSGYEREKRMGEVRDIVARRLRRLGCWSDAAYFDSHALPPFLGSVSPRV